MVRQTESQTHVTTLHAKRKRCRDVQDDEEDATSGQTSAKNPKLGSSDFENLAIIGLTRAMANLTHVSTKPASSLSTGSRKRQFNCCKSDDGDDDDDESKATIRQRLNSNTKLEFSISTGSQKHNFKSSRKCDNDDYNHESIATIRHQLYGPGGPYDNLVVISQAEKRLLCRFKPGSRKHLFKSPRTYDNDDNNYETIAMIRQQLYGPGGPYENLMVDQTKKESKMLQVKRKRCQDN
ncbi:hypothetical protein Baya_4864 [Bagarius yarrelli]|uniref:Uncharacterized protein n=1 Tax=Bagarius yarrelli TaxID=175774 RepID=A0A556TRS4_BAGYA|nr:hypothetical protein Baya_4864 [Bagarius yarrelli]